MRRMRKHSTALALLTPGLFGSALENSMLLQNWNQKV